MTDIAIRAEGLGKRYRIGGPQARYKTLRESLIEAVAGPVRAVGAALRGERNGAERDVIWALKDVSFEVRHGEVVGIIGRNGAGKSTLLKVLTRITEPTEGYAEINGRVGSLLEVGTGFHPELTGRENIYLSGAILGMKKAEIDRKFDEIVDFAGVEKFLDTPVKHYSSGMQVRLGFAVAAHLEPEVLLVDEVLAVGDAEFQKKCLGKMEGVAKEGRTVLFVSHNMAAVEHLCNRSMVLDGGRVSLQGISKDVIQYYLDTILPSSIEKTPLAETKNRSGNGAIRLMSFHVEDVHGRKLKAVRSGEDVVLVFGYKSCTSEQLRDVDVGFSVHSKDGTLSVLYSSYVAQTFRSVPPKGQFRCTVANLPLAVGRYWVGARVTVSGQEADWPRSNVGYIDVEWGDFYGTGQSGFGPSAPLLLMGMWTVRESVK